MTTILTMPDIAETVVEGTVAKWLKREGDKVALYEPLVEIVTDKVTVEVPSPAAGVLIRILAQRNAKVKVGEQLAEIVGETGESALQAEGAEKSRAPILTASAAPDSEETNDFISPIVQRLARQLGVDLAQVKGTGLGGRVRKQDVTEFAAEKVATATSSPAPTVTSAPGPSSPASLAAGAKRRVLADGDIEVEMTPIRSIIAQRMSQSVREVAHAFTAMQADVTGLVALRESEKGKFRQLEGVPLTYLPFFVKAAAEALKAHPELNSIWSDGKRIQKKAIHIGIAIDRPEGLIVPTLRDADQKSIAGLAKALHALINRARENKLSVEEVQGATFTVNNTGAFGVILSVPIVNQPQAAILATDAILKQPVVIGDAVAIRSMMHLSISFDHRMLDGGHIGRFLQTIKRSLEAYGPGAELY